MFRVVVGEVGVIEGRIIVGGLLHVVTVHSSGRPNG